MSVQKAFEQALALSYEDRRKLFELLRDNLESGEELSEDEWSAAWAPEIKSRIDAYERGEVETFSHEEVMAELRAKRAKP